jgi:hypothetical protein
VATSALSAVVDAPSTLPPPPPPLLPRESCDDHPLSLDAGSRWRTFFQDNEILEQITRDVMRTHPDMHFFTGDTEEAELHRQARDSSDEQLAWGLHRFLNTPVRVIRSYGLNVLFRDAHTPQAVAHHPAGCIHVHDP